MPADSILSATNPPLGSEVLPDERTEYGKFSNYHVGTVGRSLPAELWHYTTADGLIGILKTGTLFSTQVSCLNDSVERLYFGDLVLEAIKERSKKNTDPKLAVLYQTATAALANRNIWAAGYFVTCFSEVADDLSQWRGYGSGVNGFAIGFDSAKLFATVSRRGALMFPMEYQESKHRFLVDEIMQNAEIYFLSGLARGRTDIEAWAKNFLVAFSLAVEWFTCTIKHPKFFREEERRIGRYFIDTDRSALEFKSKQTMIARHLPLDLADDVGGQKLLPLTRICVGPSAGQKASRIAIGDMLINYGYQNVPVELSTVPYRVV